MPLRVLLKVIGGLPSFRGEAVTRVVPAAMAAMAAGGHRGDFRVVTYNVLGDHRHFVVEAAGSDSAPTRALAPAPAGDGRGEAMGVRNADVLERTRSGAIVVPALTGRGAMVIVPKS